MRAALIGAWMLFFSAFAHAQSVSLAAGLGSIPISNILIACGLSFVGGVAWTSQKEAKAEIENKKIFLTIFSDILVSVVAGLVTFFLLSLATDSALLQAALITLSGYGGTRIMDSYLTVLVDRIKGLFTGKQA